MHQVAVRVVDNEGLENTEVIQVKINGKITRVSASDEDRDG